MTLKTPEKISTAIETIDQEIMEKESDYLLATFNLKNNEDIEMQADIYNEAEKYEKILVELYTLRLNTRVNIALTFKLFD